MVECPIGCTGYNSKAHRAKRKAVQTIAKRFKKNASIRAKLINIKQRRRRPKQGPKLPRYRSKAWNNYQNMLNGVAEAPAPGRLRRQGPKLPRRETSAWNAYQASLGGVPGLPAVGNVIA